MLFSAISIGEISVVAILAFMVLGPDKLPEAARELGKFVKQARTIMRNLNDEINKEMGAITKDTGLDETAKDIREAVGETTRTRRIIQDAYKNPVKSGIQEIRQVGSQENIKTDAKQVKCVDGSKKQEEVFLKQKAPISQDTTPESEFDTVVVEELPPPEEQAYDKE